MDPTDSLNEFHRGNPPPPIQTNRPWKFWFGYHNSTDTYKIVALFPKAREVRIFNLSDGVWRIIQRFPLVSLNTSVFRYTHMAINNGVYVSGTLNWLVIQNTGNESPYDYFGERITVDNFVIISLDLSTETYRQLRLPRGFDKVPPVELTLIVLMDSICFSHDFHKTHFIIWQMKEFGVEDSWTQFLKISYRRLSIVYQGPSYMLFRPEFLLLPLCLSENGDTLILASDNDKQAILYNLRDNKVETTRITNQIQWFRAKECVESLILPNRMTGFDSMVKFQIALWYDHLALRLFFLFLLSESDAKERIPLELKRVASPTRFRTRPSRCF
ncbi:F-box protein interaction domain protein [Medicago truncatula]|uniref:F-box protein interaction domain protein n=1 Tax=Medicago truncatula TaxID=3880 RepID=A0A072TYW5_MEDTR|nr:F-box protein interaction domain protein [Medicago truncatula]